MVITGKPASCLRNRHWLSLYSCCRRSRRSFLAHSSNINDLLEGLDGVLEDWLNRLHDTKSSFHIIDLWLHSFDGLHLSGNFNEWLSIIESLEDSGSKGFLDVLDGSGLGNGGITISSRFGWKGSVQFWLEWYEKLVLIHSFVGFHSFEELWLVMVMVVVSGGDSGDESGVFHCLKLEFI